FPNGSRQRETRCPSPDDKALVILYTRKEVGPKIPNLVISGVGFQGESAGRALPIFGRKVSHIEFQGTDGFHTEPAFKTSSEGIVYGESIQGVEDLLFRASIHMDTSVGVLHYTRHES